jgi:hypothetical protein
VVGEGGLFGGGVAVLAMTIRTFTRGDYGTIFCNELEFSAINYVAIRTLSKRFLLSWPQFYFLLTVADKDDSAPLDR